MSPHPERIMRCIIAPQGRRNSPLRALGATQHFLLPLTVQIYLLMRPKLFDRFASFCSLRFLLLFEGMKGGRRGAFDGGGYTFIRKKKGGIGWRGSGEELSPCLELLRTFRTIFPSCPLYVRHFFFCLPHFRLARGGTRDPNDGPRFTSCK